VSKTFFRPEVHVASSQHSYPGGSFGYETSVSNIAVVGILEIASI
jgi:hypothetical protein